MLSPEPVMSEPLSLPCVESERQRREGRPDVQGAGRLEVISVVADRVLGIVPTVGTLSSPAERRSLFSDPGRGISLINELMGVASFERGGTGMRTWARPR